MVPKIEEYRGHSEANKELVGGMQGVPSGCNVLGLYQLCSVPPLCIQHTLCVPKWVKVHFVNKIIVYCKIVRISPGRQIRPGSTAIDKLGGQQIK